MREAAGAASPIDREATTAIVAWRDERAETRTTRRDGSRGV
jgi:hypothetical protein